MSAITDKNLVPRTPEGLPLDVYHRQRWAIAELTDTDPVAMTDLETGLEIAAPDEGYQYAIVQLVVYGDGTGGRVSIYDAIAGSEKFPVVMPASEMELPLYFAGIGPVLGATKIPCAKQAVDMGAVVRIGLLQVPA